MAPQDVGSDRHRPRVAVAIESIAALPDSEQCAHEIARLRRERSVEDGVDAHSTLEQLPGAEDLARAFQHADIGLVALTPDRAWAGYGLVRTWTEDDGTIVHLLDCWAVPEGNRGEVEAMLFGRLEALLRDTVSPLPGTVFGANSRSTEPGRARLLEHLGFRPVFDMVEMDLSPHVFKGRPLPPDVTLRTANLDDAPAIAALEERVWAGRRFYSAAGLEATRQWLTDVDLELCLLAEHQSHLVGLASANITPRCAEIDDVQVDPSSQRRGIGAAMVSQLVVRLAGRTTAPIRLHTEGHDPAGARSLYERLGFTVVGTHHRYRKALA